MTNSGDNSARSFLRLSGVFGGALSFGLCLVACLCLALAGGIYFVDENSRAEMVYTRATVTGNRGSATTDSNGYATTTYCPVVEFTTTTGDLAEVTVNDCATPAAYQKGDVIEIYYNPQNVEDVQLVGGARSFVVLMFTAMCGIGGLLVGLVGVASLVGSAWLVRRPQA